ncbi:DUF6980 family protein [Nocardia otitidiscaviarum]|uniref:DUF6980 family protein n=1 Tax=Nocardia otitidiscaviarum TaxID=1823 RepID=UPI003CC7D7F3
MHRFNYCPWCGAKLPDSLRDEWFDRIFDLGLDGPEDVRIPVDMRTDAWWANPGEAPSTSTTPSVTSDGSESP